ncbi:MAG: DUF5686 family protein [bacterium]
MRSKSFLILFICLSMSPFSFAQKTIRGVIKDEKTENVLPHANIQIVGTYRGTITNDAGKYVLEIKQLPATVLVRYIGYLSKAIEITENSSDIQNILLTPTVIELPTIVVTGEDPAVNIMRKVIQKKQAWRSLLETYKADAYTRVVLENDTGIIFISESASEVYWDKNKGSREIIKSKRETSNPEQNFAFASHISNLYDDDIELMGFKIIGPTHPDAIRSYDFKLDGYRTIDDKTVYDISVSPKSKLQPTFVGRISVLGEDYAMIDVDLKPSDAILFPQPIQSLNLHFKQQFSDFRQAFWLPVDVRIDGDIRIGMIGLQFPSIKYSQISRLSDYRVNAQLPDSLFHQKRRIVVDSLSVKKNALLASAPRVIPLTQPETKAYATLDSSMTIEKAFQPTGFLAKFTRMRMGSDEAQIDVSGENRKSRRILAGLSPRFQYNRVDGFHLGLRYNIKPSENIQLHFLGGYSTGIKRWTTGGGLDFKWSKENGFFNTSYMIGTDTRYTSDSYPLILSSLHTLFGLADYFDYFWNERWHTSAGYRFRKIRTEISVGLRNERHASLSKTTDWNILGRDEDQRPNPPIQEGRLRSVVASVVIGEERIPWGAIGQNRFEFRIEHSTPQILGSDFSFTRYQMKMDIHFSTFLRRRLMPNAVDFRLVAGTSTGSLPIQRFGTMDARLGGFTPFGSFKTLTNQPMEGEKYIGLFWEYNFRTVPFELLGLDALARNGLGVILHGASGRTWISDERLTSLNHEFQYLNGFYREIGLSVNSLFGFFRLDVTKHLNRPGLFVGISMARMF